MKRTETSLDGCYIIELDRHDDVRASFMRGFDKNLFETLGLPCDVDHTAEAVNHAAFTLRGLHFQAPAHPEPKLVRCLRGVIFDVVVDIRQTSPTFGRWQSVRLESDDAKALLVPAGFAHGYMTLASSSVVAYHLFAPYHAEAQRGILWNDPYLQIEWPAQPRIISERDLAFPCVDRIDPRDFEFSSDASISDPSYSEPIIFREVS